MGGGASKSNAQATEGSPAKGTKSSFISTRQLPVHTSEEVNLTKPNPNAPTRLAFATGWTDQTRMNMNYQETIQGRIEATNNINYEVSAAMGKTAKIRDAAEAFHDKWPLRVKGYNCRLESKLELIGTGETPVGLAMFQGWRRGDASSMHVFGMQPRHKDQPPAMKKCPHDPSWKPAAPPAMTKKPSASGEDVVDAVSEALDQAKEVIGDSVAYTPYPDAGRLTWVPSKEPLLASNGQPLYDIARLLPMGCGPNRRPSVPCSRRLTPPPAHHLIPGGAAFTHQPKPLGGPGCLDAGGAAAHHCPWLRAC